MATKPNRRKPIVARALARTDVDEAVDFYVGEAGQVVALGFISALERAYGVISQNPAIGSPRYAHELNIPGLRSRMVKKYPYLIFYVERADHVDVWRVLNAHRDIPRWMTDPDDT